MPLAQQTPSQHLPVSLQAVPSSLFDVPHVPSVHVAFMQTGGVGQSPAVQHCWHVPEQQTSPAGQPWVLLVQH